MKDYILKIFKSHSGVSSKRVCGVLGFAVCLCIASYCTIYEIEAPKITDTILLCCMGLLSVDSVTGVWKKI